MERAGCLNYSHTPWENDKLDVFMRQIYYKFNKGITRYRGEVTSTQQKTRLSDRQGWLIEEIMTLHGVPLGDYFNVRCRYIKNLQYSDSAASCMPLVEVGRNILF